MKKFLFYWLLFLIVNTVKAQTTNQKTTQDSTTMSVLVGFANAFNAHDVNTILSFMANDCVFLASAGPDAFGEKFEGKEAVKKAFEDVFKTYPDAHWGNVTYFIAGNRTVTEVKPISLTGRSVLRKYISAFFKRNRKRNWCGE